MFEDLITSKPKITECKLAKNGVMIESAIVDMSDYVSKGEGYITCDGLDIQATDEFRLHIVYKRNAMLSTTVIAKAYLTKLADGRIKFSIGV